MGDRPTVSNCRGSDHRRDLLSVMMMRSAESQNPAACLGISFSLNQEMIHHHETSY